MSIGESGSSSDTGAKPSIVVRDEDGVLSRTPKDRSAIPQYLKFPVESAEDFEEIKLRFDPSSPERYPEDWESLVKLYHNRSTPLGLNINGFFGQMRNWMGFENLAYAYHDQPDLVNDMIDFWVDYSIRACQRAFEEVEFDFVHFWEDMSYNQGMMISPNHFRRFMSPAYKKVIDFAKSYGVDIFIVDSDGRLYELVPLLLESGINGILPIEITPGNDPVAIRERYKDLLMLGGIDKRVLAFGPEAIEKELTEKLPYLLSIGGYIPALDHWVPPDISLDNYKFYLELKARLLRAG